jgi:hypothetical protein
VNRFFLHWKSLLDAVWLVALALYILAGYDDVPFHGDESTLTYMSRDYHDLVQRRDLDSVLYRDPPATRLRRICASSTAQWARWRWASPGIWPD